MSGQAERQRLYVHATVREYLDYGEYTGVERGVMYSWNGQPGDAFGFTFGRTVAEAIERAKPYPSLELAEGEQIRRRIDINPHGFM